MRTFFHISLLLCGFLPATFAQEVLINEFMAGNDTVLADEDGDFSDWIELYNPSPFAVALDGWFLTDDATIPDKWRIPDVTLASGGYLVLFASGKDRIDPAHTLHTNFRLSGGGEYLALVRPDETTIEHAYEPQYPEQLDDISFGMVRETVTLVPEGAAGRWYVPLNDNESDGWTGGQPYDDSFWDAGQAALGFDNGLGGYASHIFTDVSTNMFGINNSIYLRVPFDAEQAGQYESLQLNMRYDDGFIAYLNGQPVASANAPDPPEWNSAASGTHADSEAVVFRAFTVTNGIAMLSASNNILAVHGLNASPDDADADFLLAPEIQAVRCAQNFLAEPTPGEPNSGGLLLTDVAFFPTRGIFAAPIQVELGSTVPGVEIRYTTDFSTPDENSPLYTGLIPVSSSTVIRATAFLEGFVPSKSVTHTYLFHDSTMNQPNNPPGFPATWGNQAAEYQMRGSVVGAYTEEEFESYLEFLPSISITTDMPNLFDDRTGIYDNPNGRGTAWERPASVEWIPHQGSPGIGVNCGIRIQGGLGGGGRNYKKRSFRFLFKSQYGPSKLRYDLYNGDRGATDTFDQLILRRGANDIQDYTRDEYARRCQLDVGGVASHGNFSHVYVNGLYWGMYNVVERPAGDFASSYFGGGDKDNWDALAHNSGNVINGDNQAWNQMIQMGRNGLANNDAYLRLQGRDPDGTRNPALPHLCDVDNHIQYMLANIYLGMGDWPHHNWYAARQRDAESTGYKFFIWDGEGAFGGGDVTGVSNGIAEPWGDLRANAEFRLRVADHVQQYFFNNGPLTPEPARERFSRLSDSMEFGVITESARWGHISHSSWQGRRNSKLNSYLVSRSNTVLGYLRNANLFPPVEAPVFNQNGGLLTNGFELAMSSADAEDIWYTLDNSDPREFGSGNPVGTRYTGPVALAWNARVKARGRKADGTWSAMTEALFNVDEPSPLRITEVMYHGRDPTGVETNVAAASDAFDFIEIRNTGAGVAGLAGVHFSDGIDFDFSDGSVALLQPGESVLVVKDRAAFDTRYPGFTGLIAGAFAGELNNNGERIELSDLLGEPLIAFSYGDGRDWPQSADGAGHSLVPLDLANQPLNALDYGGNWRASAFIDGSPGAADPAPTRTVLLNELAAVGSDWVELFNTTGDPVDLGDWYLSNDEDVLDQWPLSGMVTGGGWISFDNLTVFDPILDLDEFGDQLLLSHLPGGAPGRVADAIRFKAQEPGATHGRFPDGIAPWRGMPASRDAANLLAPPAVVITEIMYHPRPTPENPEDNQNDEYVELRNVSGSTVEASTIAGPWRLDGGIGFPFPEGLSIAAGERVVIVPFDPADEVSRTDFERAYGLAPGEVTLLGPYAGRLSNRGERVGLEKPVFEGSGFAWVVIEEVNYFDRAPWPPEADGTGRPLRRIDPQGPGDDAANWIAGFAASPGLADPAITIVRPEFGATLLNPAGLPAEAAIDAAQVAGAVQQVEFFIDGVSECVVITPPYTCSLASLTAEGTYALTASFTDAAGVHPSRPVDVVVGSLRNLAPSGIGPTTATLNGELTRNGRADVTVYWGLTDGGTDTNAWEHAEHLGWQVGDFAAPVHNLLASAPYRYRCFATNAHGFAWSAVSTNLLTGPARVALSLGAGSISENGGSTLLTANLAELSFSNITVNLDFAGSAIFGTDYTASATSVVISAGTVSAAVTIDGRNDDEVEAPETILASIDSVFDAVPGSPDSAALSLISDDISVVNRPATNITEYTATLQGEMRFGDRADVTLYWGLTDGGTNAVDWDHAEDLGSLGEGLFATNVSGLLASQPYFYRSFAANASGSDWADATTNFTSTLTAFHIADAGFREGDLGPTRAFVDISLSATSALDAVVHFATADGTGLAGIDYAGTNGTLTIPAGTVTGRIELVIIGDADDEYPSESFFVDLSAPQDAVIGDARAELTIIDDDADVHLVDWSHRMKIGFPGYDGSEALADFPVLVQLGGQPDFDYARLASPAGHDLRFADARFEQLLDYEIEHWDTNGISQVWVKLPRLEGTNTCIWAVWGNPASAASPPDYTLNGATFSGGFDGVYHFAESAGSVAPDSSPGGQDGTLRNMNDADWVPGLVGNALDFDGANDGVDTPIPIDQSAGSRGATFSAWVQPHTANGNYERVFSTESGSWEWALALDSSRAWEVFTGNNQFSSGHTGILNRWQHVAAVFDPSLNQVRVYLNGVERVINDLGFNTTGRNLSIGHENINNLYDGLIDEARVSPVTRSADWIRATWLNSGASHVFNDYGPVHTDDPGAASLLMVYGATNVVDTAAVLTARMTATGAEASVIDVYWGAQDGGTDPGAWTHHRALGPAPAEEDTDLSAEVGDLAPNTEYFYAYRASSGSGTNWASTSFFSIGAPQVVNLGYRDPGPGTSIIGARLPLAGSAEITLYWGTADGGTDPEAWEHQTRTRLVEGYGSFEEIVDGLLYGQTYVYRGFATNAYGSAWSATAEPFYSGRPATRHRAGLYEGLLAGRNNWVDPNPRDAVALGPYSATTMNRPPWADNITWCYEGQVYLNGQTVFFAENVDDDTRLVIDGEEVLRSGCCSPAGSAAINKPAGWYDFDVRFSNGGGPGGGISSQGWGGKGFGIAYGSVPGGTPQGGNYLFPEDNGNMNLFRHLPDGAAGEGAGELAIFNGPATDITGNSARAEGFLSASGSVFRVWIHWGEADGGTNAWEHSEWVEAYTNVSEAALSAAINGLEPETRYHYSFSASNDVEHLWAQPSRSFISGANPLHYAQRMKITFSEYDAGTVLTNFPALVVLDESLPGFSYQQFASQDGRDLRFTDPNDVTLHHEIERWDPGGSSHVWVKVPTLEPSGQDFIYAYWGSGTAGQPAYSTNGLTWSEHYVGVFHLQDDGDDSGAAMHHAAPLGTPTAVSEGQIGGTFDYEADSDYHQAADHADFTLSGDYTVSAWIHSDNIGNQNEGFVGTYNGEGFIFALDNDGINSLQFWADGVWRDSNVAIPDGEWKFVAYTREGSVGRFYVDGREVASVSAVAISNGGALHLGAGGTSWPNDRFDGRVDEVRVSAATRSADWLMASWLNQASNAFFNVYGQAEAVDPDLPWVSNATGGASGLADVSAELNGILISTGAAPTEVWVYWGTTDEGTNLTWESEHYFGFNNQPLPAVYRHTADNLQPNTTYHYRFRARNALGQYWAFAGSPFTTYGPPLVGNRGGAVPDEGEAVLHGELLDGGEADIRIFWGARDGGMDPAGWDHHAVLGRHGETAFSTVISNLYYGLEYFYRSHASNDFGTAWAEASAFLTPAFTGGEPGLTARVYDTIWGDNLIIPISNLELQNPDGEYTHLGTIDYSNWTQMDAHYPALTGGSTLTLSWHGVFRSQGGAYTFGTSSDDGSVVYFDLNRDGDFDDVGELVVDNRGLHGVVTRTASVTLPAGEWPIAMGFYENGGGEVMRVRWKAGNNLSWGELDVLDTSSGDFLTDFKPDLVGLTIDSATDVAANTARLNAGLMATGSVFEVFAFWGLNDVGPGGSWDHSAHIASITNLPHIAFSPQVGGLEDDRTYFFTFSAQNAATNIWPAQSLSFTTLLDTDDDGEADITDSDDDNDGSPDSAEGVAGTDPLDPLSVLRLRIGITGPDSHLLSFPSLTDRLYDIEFTADLRNGPWTPLITGRPGDPGTTDLPQNTDAAERYYRIKVRLGP